MKPAHFLLILSAAVLAALFSGCASAPEAARAAPPEPAPAGSTARAETRHSQTVRPAEQPSPGSQGGWPSPPAAATNAPQTLDAEAVREIALLQRRPHQWEIFLERWDANRDGEINAEEYAWYKEWHSLRTAFKPLYDADGDGKVDPSSQAHFSQAVRELNEAYFVKPE